MPKIEYFKRLVFRFWLFILVASVCGGFLGGVISRITYKPEYQVVQAFTIEVKARPDANKVSVNQTQLSKTVPALLSSETFMEHMAPIISKAGAKGKFQVTSLESSNIFYITCIARNNNDAQIIINEIQSHYCELADHVIGESKMKFLAPPSYSKFPINTPHYTISALIGLLLGALMVSAVLLLTTIISNTVVNIDEVEDEINTKCLAVVKRVYTKKRSGESKKERTPLLISNEKAEFNLKKSISTLSANVHQKCIEEGFKSILVTSTLAGEGKSTIALNLALDLADKGQKVVIVDYDLRSPTIAENLNIKETSIPLSKAVNCNNISDYVTKTFMPNLYFCGNTKDNITNFDDVKDVEISKIINNLKQHFDYVIIDTAPIGFLGDALSISSVADCFAYVIAYNGANKQNIFRCISTLNETNQHMLGFVLNNK